MPGYWSLTDFEAALWQRFGLNRWLKWTMPSDGEGKTSSADLRRGYARNSICQHANKVVSQAALNGELVFWGRKAATAKSPPGDKEAIPSIYFGKTRTLADNNILEPQALGDPIEAYMAARAGGAAHPTWHEVMVEQEGAEQFLQKQGSYVAELVPPSRSPPIDKRLSPCEAVSWLAHGVAKKEGSGFTFDNEQQEEAWCIAEQLLLEAAQRGFVTIHGKEKWSREETVIPADLFQRDVGFSVLDNDLIVRSMADILAGTNWRELSVDGDSFRNWLRESLSRLADAAPAGVPSTPGALPTLTLEQLKELYKSRVETWPPGVSPPSLGDDWKWLKEQSLRVPRQHARDLRMAYAPESWHIGGPRRRTIRQD